MTTINTIPVNSDADPKDLQTVVGKLLQLALKEADRLKEQEWETKELEKVMVVQKKEGARHDRAWALSKKKDKIII